MPIFRGFVCCLSSQRYNFLKANHNPGTLVQGDYWLFIKSKIQFFESKSQLPRAISLVQKRCLSSQRYNFLKANHNVPVSPFPVALVVYQVKDTIFWKQITTIPCLQLKNCRLFIKSKIQFFESKSQQEEAREKLLESCLSSQRYNFLKANHNSHWRTWFAL